MDKLAIYDLLQFIVLRNNTFTEKYFKAIFSRYNKGLERERQTYGRTERRHRERYA